MPSIPLFLPLGVHPFSEAYHTFSISQVLLLLPTLPTPKQCPALLGFLWAMVSETFQLESEKAAVFLCVQNKIGKPDHMFILKLKFQNLI